MVTQLGTNPRSQIRHRPINPPRAGAIPIATPRTSAHPSRVLRPQRPYDEALIDELTSQHQAPDTSQDTQVAPSVRGATKILPENKPHKQWHPLVWVGITLFVIIIVWWLTTAFWGWIIVHTSDAVTFGPTHGTVITAVIGGGDSQDHPTTLVAINNKGSVQIIRILANDPSKSKLLVFADLVAAGVPDPTNADIELKAHSDHIDMTIYTTVWDKPFSRLARTFVLVEDGQGNLKMQQS